MLVEMVQILLSASRIHHQVDLIVCHLQCSLDFTFWLSTQSAHRRDLLVVFSIVERSVLQTHVDVGHRDDIR